MSNEEIAISVNNVVKSFRIPLEGSSGLKQKLINRIKGRHGYRDFKPLNDISFQINKGDFFGIVGRNGSGKSTLLKTIAGIYSPNSGSIKVNGTLVPFIELGVGFNPELTGRENVYLNGALLGFSRSEITAMYDDIVSFAELDDFMDERLKNYSSGMQVRLAFSIAIRAESDILVLDEVLAVGDADFQRKCYEYFMSLKNNKRTVVLVTHDMSAVRQYCNRAILIENGEILKAGHVEEVAQEYQKLFLHNDESSQNADDDSWGDGGVEIKNVKVKPNNDTIRISATFKATKDIEPPVYGFTLFNKSGTDVLEGNTIKERTKTAPVSKNDSVTIEWEFPNILADGTYTLSVACCDESVTNYYQWLNNAAEFKITKDERTSGIVDPKIEVTIK